MYFFLFVNIKIASKNSNKKIFQIEKQFKKLISNQSKKQ